MAGGGVAASDDGIVPDVDRGRLRAVFLTAVVSVAMLATPSAAAATSTSTFGIPLGTAPFNLAPTYPYDCSEIFNPFLGVPTPFPSPNGGSATSCIWSHVPTPAETAAAGGRNISLEPPGTGTVTEVRVGVGASTGPMRVVVMRALYENTLTPGRPNDACCIPVAQSQVFTPRANTITAVPVSLPVREDPTPPPEDITTIADFDTLGLAVLAPGVPVPLYYTGDPSAPADFVWNTATPSTITPGFSTDTGGFFVALGADWRPGAAGAGTPLNLGNRIDPVRAGNANVGLSCATSITCIGQLLLQNAQAPGAQLARGGGAVPARKLITYGSAAFRIAAHRHRTIVVHLSSGAKRLVRQHRSTRVWANIKLATGAHRRYAIRITLHH